MSEQKTRAIDRWQTLIRRYCPEGSRVCNCGDAYETFCPAATKTAMRGGEWIDSWGCAGGCSAAQIEAREHVARCVIAAEEFCKSRADLLAFGTSAVRVADDGSASHVPIDQIPTSLLSKL